MSFPTKWDWRTLGMAIGMGMGSVITGIAQLPDLSVGLAIGATVLGGILAIRTIVKGVLNDTR